MVDEQHYGQIATSPYTVMEEEIRVLANMPAGQ
jgi:hypothetical protein